MALWVLLLVREPAARAVPCQIRPDLGVRLGCPSSEKIRQTLLLVTRSDSMDHFSSAAHSKTLNPNLSSDQKLILPALTLITILITNVGFTGSAKDYFLPNFLHPANCELLETLKKIPPRTQHHRACGPTVGANCRGIVTADVLSVRT